MSQPATAQVIDGIAGRLLPRCLTPDVGRVMQELVAAGRLQAPLGSAFTLERGNVGADQIELEIQDAEHHAYRVVLALSALKRG